MKMCLILLLFICSSLQAQQGWWTWMHGTSAQNAAGNYGTIGVAAATNNPPGLYEPGEWTDQQGNFWIFGGLDGGHNEHAALWKFDPVTNMWTWMKGPSAALTAGVYGTQGIPAPGNNPGARSWGASTWVDNNNNLWLFGGEGYDGTGSFGNLNDLWMYNITTNEWTWMKGSSTQGQGPVYGTQMVAAAANTPQSRYESGASWTDNNGNLFLFGGITFNPSFGNLNDLWKYNVSTNMWTWMRGSNVVGSPGNYGTLGVSAPTNDPSARSAYAKWKDSNGNLWFFGGSDVNVGTYNDLWKYNVATNEWTWMHGSNTTGSNGSLGPQCTPLATNDPSSRNETRASWTDHCGNFWMYGGGQGGSFNTTFADMWYYNVQNNQWSFVSGMSVANAAGNWGTVTVPAATNHPSSRAGSVAFKDLNGALWLFGGTQFFGPTAYNDIWKFIPDTTSCTPSTCAPLNSSFLAVNGCLPYNTTFTNTSSGASNYFWDFGVTTLTNDTSNLPNPLYNYTTPGTYTVTLIAYNGVTSDTSFQIVTVTSAPTATISGNDTICAGTPTTLTAGGGGTYTWSTGATTSPITVTPAINTTYSVVVSNGTCTDTAFMNVVVNPIPNAAITGTTSICTGSSTTLTATGGGTYLWNTGSTSSVITVNPTVTTTYSLDVSNGLCSDTTSVTVNVFQYPTPAITGDTLVCLGESTTLTATGGLTYLWNTGQTTSSISFLPTVDSTYIVTAYNGPCPQSDSISIVVLPPPVVFAGLDDTIMLGTSTVLTANGTGTSYLWSPSYGLSCTTCQNPTAAPYQTTTYYVTTTDANGCTSIDSVIIYVNQDCGEVFVPKAFSPNGDGQNDYECLYGRCLLTLEFSIYDRWGEKVFEATDISQCWDGTFRGEAMNPAVFVYYLNATLLTGETIVKKGNITLVK